VFSIGKRDGTLEFARCVNSQRIVTEVLRSKTSRQKPQSGFCQAWTPRRRKLSMTAERRKKPKE
jgi:hypothetical protein